LWEKTTGRTAQRAGWRAADRKAPQAGAGAIEPLLRGVDDGASVSDHDGDERRRKMSRNLSLIPCQVQTHKLHVLDTPGHKDNLTPRRRARFRRPLPRS
jgi:hypothetical protein